MCKFRGMGNTPPPNRLLGVRKEVGFMLNFVNHGTDEAILKSLPIDGASDELIKAMGKQGLVQKEVQVRGKNGKIFTRKQWVKAGETSSDVKPQKKPEPDEKYEDDEFGDFTAADQQKAHELAKKIAKEFGGKKVEKLGNFGYVFESDYTTVKKVVEKYKLEENFDGYSEDDSENEGFDYGVDTKLSDREGQIFCNQGGFQNDDRILIGVSFNDL